MWLGERLMTQLTLLAELSNDSRLWEIENPVDL